MTDSVCFAFHDHIYKEKLFTDQELLKLVIFSSLLANLMCDSRVISWGEIRYLSLERVIGLTLPYCKQNFTLSCLVSF